MRRGFSLVETILALGLLGTLLLLAAFLVPSCVLSCKSADLRAQAESVGQSQLESLRAQPFSQLAGGTETVGIYRVTSELRPEPDCAAAEACRVRVTVDWQWRGRDYSWSREGTLHASL